MPWTPPSDPLTSTVITVAYAVANLLTQIRWLRLMMGNADPPGSNYVVTSDSVSATSWKTGGAAITNVLGYTPANKGGDTFTGAVSVAHPLTVAKANDTGDGGRVILEPSSGQVGATIDATSNLLRIYGTTSPSTPLQFGLVTGILTLPSLSSLTTGAVQGTAPSGAAGYNLDASSNQFRVYNPSDPSKVLQFGLANGTLTLPTVNATTTGSIQGAIPSGAAGYNIDASGNQFRVFNAANATFMLAFGLTTNVLTVGGSAVITAATIGTQSVASAGTAANASQVGGKTPTATPTANAIPISDGTGKLDAWVTPAAFSIPSGLGCWVRTASEIPAGFARETALDGLLPVGAGHSFDFPASGSNIVEATSYGNTWLHQHTIAALAVPVSVSVSGSATGGSGDNTSQPSATGGTASGTPPPSFGTGTHTHSLNGVSLAVSASGGGSGSTTATNTGNVTWLPPMRAVVWARKS